MPQRIAIKRLTASDLTFFESIFRTIGAGNQKAINLNADVFIDRLYPSLPDLVSTLSDVIPVTLAIFGPAGAPIYKISRAITKRDAYKNWRLNGEFIRDPEGEPGRFDILQPSDLAVMEFGGDPGPQRIKLLLLAGGSPIDASLHAALNPLVPGGRRTMIQTDTSQISTAASGVAPSHPIWSFAADPEFDAALEDAAQGGSQGTAILTKKTAKKVTAAALAAAKASAEKNGRDGEALAWVQLQRMKASGVWVSTEWLSQANAVSSFDFRAIDAGGTEVRIDAKSTNGEFERVIHMSAAELLAAAGDSRYDLWRIYGINGDGAKLRIAENIGDLAKSIVAALEPPKGITVDAVSINPTALAWGKEIEIERPEESFEE